MTAVATLTGALSDRMTVRRLQVRMVKVVPHGTIAFRKGRLQGLSCLKGNCAPCHARSELPPEEAGVQGR
jgi:hypothetical protein